MPIYEYECGSCGNSFSVLVLSASKAENAVCPSCGSQDTRKLISTFACSQGSGGHGGGGMPAGGT